MPKVVLILNELTGERLFDIVKTMKIENSQSKYFFFSH